MLPSPVPQPASRIAAGASLTTSRRESIREPTSRCSTATLSYVVAARANARLTARGSRSRGSGSGGSVAIDESERGVKELLAVRDERHVAGGFDHGQPRARQRASQPLARPERYERIARAGDDQRRLLQPARRRPQVDAAQDRERGIERRAVGTAAREQIAA